MANAVGVLPFVVVALLPVACRGPGADVGHVEAEGFSCEVTISAQSTAAVGEWIDLEATRRCGPWRQVSPEEARRDPCGFIGEAPPELERETVPANLSWVVTPDSHSQFNLPTPPDLLARRVKFDRPGRYRLTGRSASCGGPPYESNEIEITVAE